MDIDHLLGYGFIEINQDAIPSGAILKMLVMAHDGIIKAFDVLYTDFEKCNTGLQISESHTHEDQMCVRLPIHEYLEIVGTDSQAASSSTSRTTVIEKVLYTYKKF